MPLKKGNKLGNRFSKTNQPSKNGRKPSRMNLLFSAFKVEDETRSVGKEDIFKLMAYILGCTKGEIETMLRNPELPFSVACQIRAIITDVQNGKTDTIDRIFDRVYGKATTPMELTGAKGVQLIPDEAMSRRDFEKLLSDLKCGAK